MLSDAELNKQVHLPAYCRLKPDLCFRFIRQPLETATKLLNKFYTLFARDRIYVAKLAQEMEGGAARAGYNVLLFF